MSRQKFLTAAGGSLILVGVMFSVLTSLVFPPILVDATTSATTHNLQQNVGVFVLCVGIINVMARNGQDVVTMRAVLVGSLLAIVLSGALDLYALLASIFKPVGWGVIVFKSALTGGYAYFLSKLR